MKKQNMITGIKIIPALFFLSMLVPGLQAQNRVSGNNIKHTFINTKEGLSVEYDGKIILGADERSIKAISEGGYLRLRKTTSENSRELLIDSRGNSLNYVYIEGGRVKPFEPEGKTWLSDILPELVKTTAIAAEYRVDQLYAKGGPSKIVEALPELEGDHVRAEYIKLLLDKNITEGDISTIINAVGNQVQSDHYRFEIFKKLFPENTAVSENLIKALELLDSEHFKASLVKPMIVRYLEAGQQLEAVKLLNIIESDHFKSQIFKSVKFSTLTADAWKGVLTIAMTEIDSDHFKYTLLKSLLKSGSINEERQFILIDNVQHIGSEPFIANVLKALCNTNPHEKVKRRIRETAKTITSPHYYGEVMRCINSGKSW